MGKSAAEREKARDGGTLTGASFSNSPGGAPPLFGNHPMKGARISCPRRGKCLLVPVTQANLESPVPGPEGGQGERMRKGKAHGVNPRPRKAGTSQRQQRADRRVAWHCSPRRRESARLLIHSTIVSGHDPCSHDAWPGPINGQSFTPGLRLQRIPLR